MRSREHIKAEIERSFGFIPPFFSLALENTPVLENLWQQTLSAYVNNPLSPLFKEKLSAYLSRYCTVPYCLVCHSCTLHELGMKADEVLKLLDAPPPAETEIDKHLKILAAQPNLPLRLPETGSPAEGSLLYCAIYIAVETEEVDYYKIRLRELMGNINYQHLILLVTYIKTCHAWMEAHPEVAYEADMRVINNLDILLAEEPRLTEFFRNYVKKVTRDRERQAQKLAEKTSREQNIATNLSGIARMSQQNSQALLASQKRFRFLTEAMPQQVWTAQADGKLNYVNQRVLDYFGRSFKEIIGWGWQSMLHPDDLPECIRRWSYSLSSGETYEIEFRLLRVTDKTYRWHLGRALPMYDEDGRIISWFGTNTDIHDSKLAQEELQRQHLRSQLFAEISLKIRQSLQISEIIQTAVTEVQRILQADRVLIYRIWTDGTGSAIAEAVVPGWTSILGQSFPAETIPQNYRQMYALGRIKAIKNIDNAEIASCLGEFLQQFQVKSKVVVPISAAQELWGLLIAHHCANKREWSNFEIELLQQLANQIGIALISAQLLEQESRQRQELMRSNEELQQFAYIASHDLQEPLRKIQAFGDRLKNKYADILDSQGRDYLGRMQNAAQRMQVLINDLLTLSRVTAKAQSVVPINLTSVAVEVVSDLEILIQKTGGRVEIGELPTISASPLQMRQLLQNLIGNALKFHREEEPPLVKIYSQVLKSQEQQPTGISPIADVYQIFVEDNGIGFEEKYLDRIFNIFQRLHSRSEYSGSGMGLAICRKIVEQYGGSITAKSTPGQGTTFIATLPIKPHKGENGS